MKFKPQIRLPFNNVDEKQDLSKSPIVPPVLERLEERTLYSVDFLALPPFETSDESISDENLLDQFPLDNTIQTDSLSPVELVIIDSRVPEIDFLVDELKKQKDTGRKLQAHVIDKSEDGLQTISSILNGQLVSAIHVISHGSTSGFQLGSTWIDAENLNSYAQQLSGWKNSLTESADLLLYGCNLSTTNSGLHLSAQLGALTGADIASSSNTTGHSAIGGDWILEHHTGSIETQVVVNSAITAGWHHNLLAGTNGPDLLLGVDSANNELLGLAGNDLLIAGGDFLQFGGTHLGDFNFESNALEKNVGAGTTNSGLTINSGSVDFIPSGTYNLEVPGAARAILFQNAEVQTELAGTVPGVDYSIAFYIGGETGTHSADIKIVRSDGQSIGDSTLSFQVPGGVSYSNMIWQPIAMTFTAHSDPTTLIVKSTDGAPLMAAARVADHSSTAGSAITSIDGGTGNDTILYGAANDIVTDGAGSDIISSGNGDDEILDGPGSDIILGGRDNDKFLIFEDSPVDENQFWGGRGDDQYILKNNIHSEFTITDSIGSDAIVLQYDAAAGNANYFLPDTFSLELSGIESIKTEPAGTPDQILGDATYTNPLDWDLSFVTAIDGNISVQGGIQNDIFYNAFTGTEYRGGDGMDTVSVNALFSQIDVDRANYTGTNTSDDTQSIVITDTTQATLPTDTISDTVETLIFLDGTYDIASGNILPTLSLFSNFVATEDEDSQVLISLDRLKNQGNEEDLDGSVDAMVVQSVANGFLRIGPNAANASTWNPGVNDVIDANNNGYWIKDPAVDVNVSINLDAITVLARDNDEALSNTPIAVQVNLTPVNESLVFNNAIATTPENTPVTIVYNNDLESNWTFNKPGTFNGEPEIILVDSVVSGTLKINGVDFHPTNNYTITTSSALVWTPDLNTTTADDGIQYAFTVRVADANGNASSAAMAEITVTQDTINNLPELSVINSVVATTNEDTEVEITFAELTAAGNETDSDGTVTAMVVQAVPTGSLRIGPDDVSAVPYDPGNKDTIDAGNNAYWTPGMNAHGSLPAFSIVAKDNEGAISDVATAPTATVSVIPVNDAPAGADNTIVIDEDNAHTFSALDFGFTDTDNNVLDFVVIDTLPLSGALTLSNTAVTAGQAIPVSVLGALQFTPIAGENGTAYASFTFSVRDNGGTANGGIDTDTTANTITFDVTSINDAPTGTDNTIVIDEDVSHSFAEIDFGFTDADNNTFGSVIIDSLPLTGSLTLSNVAVSAGQAIPVGALGTLKFTPLPGESGTAYASFTFSVQDDGGTANGGINTDAIANVITFDVTSINDAPAGTDNTVSTNEDTAYTYTEADFGFTDTDGHTLQFITIESLPGNGQLTLGGVAVTVNDTVARTVIGDLKYHPAGNSNGIPNDTFEFSVTDDGGTFNGGSDTDNTPNKLTIDVQSVNDAPHGTDKVISVFEDTPFTFGLADFGFYDLVEGNAPLNVIIHSLPVNGQLEFNSTLVTNGQAIPVGSINLLKFIPEQDVNRTGYDSFSFVVQDDGGTTNGGVDTDQNPNNININVISVNDPPTLTTFTNTTQHISIIDEDGVAEISLVQLLSNGDEADVDGTVDAMVVQSVSSGTLRIGIDQDSASSFIAGSNDTIDSDRNAYWAPAAHDNGSLTAFSVVARDNDSSESSTVIPLHVSVNDVNDQPTLGNPSANVDSIDEDAEAEITFSQLSDASNLDAIDIDGTVEAMVVTSVHSGTLRIGSDSTTANVFDAINNNTINQTKNSYWTPDSNAFGTLTAFSIAAKDDDGDTSDTTSSVVLSVNDVNDKPTLNSFIPYIDTTDEDRREEVALWELLQDGDSNDIDGNIVAMVVKSVESGSLTIGPNALTATPYNPSSNSIIDGSNTAFWLPAPNTNGLIQGFSVVAKDDDNETSDTPVPLTFLVNDINDPPVLSTFTTNTPYVDTVDEDNTVSITFSELIAEGDEADPNDSDGSIVAMRVTSIDSGTLTIGTEATSAGAFGPGNNIIDGFNHAFWTPDPDANGTQQAFSVVARDDDSADSTTSVPVSVLVNDINDLPTLTTFATPADSVDEDNSVEITLNELTLAGDQADPHDADGFIVAMRITSVNSGTLKIGSDAANASVFGSGNDIVDDENHAFWTPDPDSNGTIQAFSAVARDDDGADSPNAVAVSVLVNDVNDIPTLTAFTSPVDSVDEDNTAEITFDELTAIGDQADAQDTAGSIVAMRVTSVNSGTLKIGSDEASANVFGAGNNVIDGANHAFWTPDPDANGTIQSFSVVARDDDGADSATAVPVSVLVNDINDIPTLTTFASPIDNVDEDNTAEITFNQLINAGDQADTNDLTGSVVAMRIISVDSGTLKIGTSATSANAFGPGNDIIDDTNNAFWTPDPDTNGSIQAFSVVARDDDNADSRVATPVTVLVNDINDNPTLSTFSTNNLQIDSTEEDTVVEITLNKLIDEGDEQDIDGNVVAMVVNAVESGTLSIGLDAGTAAAFAPDSNDTIDISNNAYWIPDVNTNGIIAALSITAKDDDNATSAAVTASILVNAVNDPPVITDMGVGTTFEDTTLTLDLARMHTLVQTDDVDGSVTAYKIVNVGNGTLKIGNSESEASPYIADVNDTIGSNQIAYWTPDENANTITSGLQGDLAIVAIDDLGTSSVNNGLLMIDTISINDPPDGADTTIPILEDTAYTIRAGDFGYNDIDNNNFESVIITELPAGMLTSSGIQVQVGTSLSFSEIVNGQLVFLPDADSFGNTNSIGFKVQDDGGTVAGGIATDPVSNHILFDTSPLNDSPLIFTEPVQLIEGGLIEIDESYIRALDVDDDPTDLVHTIQSLPQHGQLLLNGLSAEIGTAFTQQQIIDHELSYQHDGSESQSDSFSVQLIDGGEDGSEAVTALIDILITEVNDAPTLGSYRLPVDNTDEDTPVEITLAELNAQGNSGDIDGNVVALLVKSVETGSLRIGLDAQNAAAYHPINNNLINAAHNAYWTPDLNANTDINDEQKSFTVKAQDDDGALSPHTASVSVIVNDINDAPVITNIDVASTLEDTPLTLDLDTLQSLVTVNDIDGNVVSYKILSVGNGTLSIGTTVETATPFTIGSNDTISVTESGYWSPATNENSDVHGLLAALTVAAIDNDGTSSNHHTLLVNTISVNDAPMGEDNSLPLMEDHTHQFDVEDFGFSDVDNDTFTSVIITELPVPGLLLLSGAQVPVDSEIPYSDIYNGLLTFTPAANFNGNLTSGIGFRVVDDGGTLHTGTAIDPSPNTLQISTTPVNDAPQFYSQNLLLDEGATVSVDASVMNAQDPDNSPADLIYTLVSPPQHGELFLHDAALQTGNQFTQQHVIDKSLTFTHDGSETSADEFSIELADGSDDNAPGIQGTVSMEISEIIDAAPTVDDRDLVVEFSAGIDSSKDDLELPLLEGQNEEVTIQLVTGPMHGTVALKADGNFAYQHDGSLFLTDQFTFRVTNSDGVYTDATVNLTIEPPVAAAFDTPVPELVDQSPEIEALPKSNTEQEAPERQTDNTQEETLFSKSEATPEAMKQRTPDSPVPVEFARNDTSVNSLINSFEDRIQLHRKWQLSDSSTDIQSDVVQLNQQTDSELSLDALFGIDSEFLSHRGNKIAENLDEQRELLQDAKSADLELISRSVTVTSTISIGYIIWLVRGGLLLGSVLSSLPAWRSFDPLPVLTSLGGDNDDDTETLESMVKEDKNATADKRVKKG